MNVGTATVGYGYEYVVSTMDRIKGAASVSYTHLDVYKRQM